nr:hypothetical protein Iba_chr07dCG4410 [Ipomoea batatas]
MVSSCGGEEDAMVEGRRGLMRCGRRRSHCGGGRRSNCYGGGRRGSCYWWWMAEGYYDVRVADALLQRGDVLTDHVLRRLGTAEEIVHHMRELRRQERAQAIDLKGGIEAERHPPRKRRRVEKKRVQVKEGRTRALQPQAGGELGQKGLPRSGGVSSHDDSRGLPTPRAVFTNPTVMRSDLVSRSSGVRRGRICWSGLHRIVVILGRDVLTIRVGHRKIPYKGQGVRVKIKDPDLNKARLAKGVLSARP